MKIAILILAIVAILVIVYFLLRKKNYITTTTTSIPSTSTTTIYVGPNTTTTTSCTYDYSYKNVDYWNYWDACDAGHEDTALYSYEPLGIAVVLYTTRNGCALSNPVVGVGNFYPIWCLYNDNHYAVSINGNGQITGIESCRKK